MPNKKAFKTVCTQLDAGEQLTFGMIGSIFGQDFWTLLVFSLMDANDAARAVQGAINRLRAGEQVEGN